MRPVADFALSRVRLGPETGSGLYQRIPCSWGFYETFLTGRCFIDQVLSLWGWRPDPLRENREQGLSAGRRVLLLRTRFLFSSCLDLTCG
ncbi:hypothetical protein Pla8534_21190 [Lignipirellula cremea]|uniref:Uncharacterized protein n=1 Tax=Lignipirellula cremea TaxID=2528010 RepID=A0A518DR58_9BACT|nr:hypothetical protein Pla8534_21190 [Lignipirellula cremea]